MAAPRIDFESGSVKLGLIATTAAAPAAAAAAAAAAEVVVAPVVRVHHHPPPSTPRRAGGGGTDRFFLTVAQVSVAGLSQMAPCFITGEAV